MEAGLYAGKCVLFCFVFGITAAWLVRSAVQSEAAGSQSGVATGLCGRATVKLCMAGRV